MADWASRVKGKSAAKPGPRVLQAKDLFNAVGSSTSPKASGLSDKLRHLATTLRGHVVQVTMISGVRFEGVWSNLSPNQLTLQMVQELENGHTRSLKGYQKARKFDMSKVLCVAARNVDVVRAKGPQVKSGFQTDTQISRRNYRERDLQKWSPDTHDEADDLDSTRPGNWDQFRENEALFGVKPEFDDDHYSTPVDKKGAFYRQHERKAEAIAKSITGQRSSNIHRAQERGQALETDFDEEALYSSVLNTSGNANSYTIPARRNTPSKSPANEKSPSPAPKKPEQVQKPVANADKPKGQPDNGSTTEKKPGVEKAKPASKFKLNPNAKEFTFNPKASPFVPGQAKAATPAPAAPQTAQPYRRHPPVPQAARASGNSPGMVQVVYPAGYPPRPGMYPPSPNMAAMAYPGAPQHMYPAHPHARPQHPHMQGSPMYAAMQPVANPQPMRYSPQQPPMDSRHRTSQH